MFGNIAHVVERLRSAEWVYDPGTHTLDPIPDAATATGINNQGVVIGEGIVPEIIDGQVADHPFAVTGPP